MTNNTVFSSSSIGRSSVDELVANLESQQPVAIEHNGSIIWMGIASKFGECPDNSIRHAVVKNLKFTPSTFGTFYGGATQSWSGLVVSI